MLLECLKNGRIVLLETDTLWGLSCDATDCNSVREIYALKKRSPNKPYILLVADIEMLSHYCKLPSNLMIEKGISYILYCKKGNGLCRNVIKNGKVCVRIPDSLYLSGIIKFFGKPIVSTSANYSGQEPPSALEQVPLEMRRSVCCVQRNLDNIGGNAEPSTIVDCTTTPFKIIRKGKYIEKIKLV